MKYIVSYRFGFDLESIYLNNQSKYYQQNKTFTNDKGKALRFSKRTTAQNLVKYLLNLPEYNEGYVFFVDLIKEQ